MRKFVVAAVLAAVAVVPSLQAAPAQAVYNGTTVSWSEHSEIAHLQYQTADGWVDWCGATFLTDNWVLTAAHCVTTTEAFFGTNCEYSLLDQDRKRDDCYIYATHGGRYYLDAKTESASKYRILTATGQTLSAATVSEHPAFQYVVNVADPDFKWYLGCLNTCAHYEGLSYVAYDFALIRLATPALGVDHVELLDNEADLSTDLPLTAYGWGDTDPSSTRTPSSQLLTSGSGALRTASRLHYPSCDPSANQSIETQKTVLCAISKGDSGTGQGDSGGPWFTTSSDGRVRQVGVTSFGPTTGYSTVNTPDMLASVPTAVKWIRSKTGLTAGSTSSGDNVATALVIDNSGSMSGNDPTLLRRDASIAYVNTAVPGDYVGAVGFESSAYDIAPMGQLPGTKQSITDALNSGVHAGGGTDIGAGLSFACAMLDDLSLPTRRAAILLTDGDGGYSNQASCFANKGWHVFTVGLGPGVNTSLLTQIANATGATYQAVPAAAELQCKFQQVRTLIAGGQTQPCQSDLIQLGQTITKVVTAASRLAQITFSTNWPGSDVEMTLTSPSGRRVTRDTVAWDVTHSLASAHEEYTIAVPEPGDWKVELFGLDIPAGGEEVQFGNSPIPFDNQLPEVTANASPASAANTWDFHADAADADGPVEEVLWDFGDGQDATGVDAKHHYGQPGTYTPTVTAVDQNGEGATFTLPAITVAAQPGAPKAAFSATLSGLAVSVNASGSTTPSGSITRYIWDFNGDGTIDADSTTPTASWTYPTAGTYTIALGVENNTGLAATSSQQVTVADAAVDGVSITFKDSKGKTIEWKGAIGTGDVRINPRTTAPLQTVTGFATLSDSAKTQIGVGVGRITKLGKQSWLGGFIAHSGTSVLVGSATTVTRESATEVVLSGRAILTVPNGRTATTTSGSFAVTVVDTTSSKLANAPGWWK